MAGLCKYETTGCDRGDAAGKLHAGLISVTRKIWKEEDTYYLIVGSKDNRQIGQVVHLFPAKI